MLIPLQPCNCFSKTIYIYTYVYCIACIHDRLGSASIYKYLVMVKVYDMRTHRYIHVYVFIDVATHRYVHVYVCIDVATHRYIHVYVCIDVASLSPIF